MNTDLLLTQTEAYTQQLYRAANRSDLLYHNLEHTQTVVHHAAEIAAHYQLDERSRFVLLVACWFHDTGQLTGDMALHEETSVQFMQDFFRGKEIDQQTITDIASCIMATKMPVAPTTLLEEIICDADTWHLGTKEFHRLDAMVWRELELRFGKPVENHLEKSLQFLEAHRFYTDYCIDKLSVGKNKNIALLKTLLS